MASTARGVDAISLPAAPLQGRQWRAPLSWNRLAASRIGRDRYTVYTWALAPIAMAVALVSGLPGDPGAVLALTGICGGLQVMLGLVPSHARGLSPSGWSFLRMAVALLYVAGLSSVVGGPSHPLLALYIPVVIAAATLGRLPAVLFGTAAALIYVAPHLSHLADTSAVGLRGIALAGVGLLAAVGVSRLVRAVEQASRRLRSAMISERRRSRQIAGLEAVSHVLVTNGSGEDTLDRALGVIAAQFHYHFVTVYVHEDAHLRLVGQRGYDAPPALLDGSHGVVGRVMRTRELAFVPDVAGDPDYSAVFSEVVSEICAPLIVDGELLGVLNVEARSTLDRADRDVVATIADRIATVLALGRDRQALAERASVLHALNEFNSLVSGELELGRLSAAMIDGLGRVVAADIVTLAVLDRETGRYVLRASTDPDPSQLGAVIGAGEGLVGRAIRDRVVVFDDAHADGSRPAFQDMDAQLTLSGVGIPLVRDGVVVGAISMARRTPAAAFRPIEIEAMELLAGQAALVVANAFLHAEVEELAVRDPLTGLYNRRHFDEALSRTIARWHRPAGKERKPIAAIMFDLDHFGQFNKSYGHQTGDQVLKTFAAVLRERFRASDLVARFGGEEFVVILEDATRDDAVRLAEEVRARLAQQQIFSDGGERLTVTVSAGCTQLDDEHPTREQLLRTADVALFMAKRAGRDRVVAA
ncbi:MAG: diguanylate cyclase [Chloroflexota bacterium]|nr:diguanylate cyclase [Chloroflexota bacterium]